MVNTNIPVTFEADGKVYRGVFQVACYGVAGYTWYLRIAGKHHGQLFLLRSGEWEFYAGMNNWIHLSDYFGAVIIAWYQ